LLVIHFTPFSILRSHNTKMKTSALIAFLSIALATASPLPQRRSTQKHAPADSHVARNYNMPDQNNDVNLLQYPFLLEQFETSFYAQGNKKFGANEFKVAGMTAQQADAAVETLQSIAINEQAHRDALRQTIVSLGGTPFESCSFDLSPLLADAATYANSARQVEGRGTSAYSGALQLFHTAAFINTGAAILAIEARQQTGMNVILGNKAVPESFDTPLLPNEILSIVHPLIQNCDISEIGLTSNANLNVVESTTGKALFFGGSKLTFSSTEADVTSDGLFCQLISNGAAKATVYPIQQCQLPIDAVGLVAVWITKDDVALINDPTSRSTVTNVMAGAQLIVVNSDSTIADVFTPDQHIVG